VDPRPRAAPTRGRSHQALHRTQRAVERDVRRRRRADALPARSDRAGERGHPSAGARSRPSSNGVIDPSSRCERGTVGAWPRRTVRFAKSAKSTKATKKPYKLKLTKLEFLSSSCDVPAQGVGGAALMVKSNDAFTLAAKVSEAR
jgi:hypothetical protein